MATEREEKLTVAKLARLSDGPGELRYDVSQINGSHNDFGAFHATREGELVMWLEGLGLYGKASSLLITRNEN